MAPSRHDWKIVDWDVKPQHNQPTFTYLDKEMFLNLYKRLTMSHLEYASPVWSPLYRKDKITIENVQRRGTRLVKSVKALPSQERLKVLGLPTLEYRRDREDLIQVHVYTILHNIDKVDKEKLFTMSHIQKLH